jgi:hypothetical protein|nr:MAG TPA: hypothetical protein [Caudoviricetes sp.]
MKKDWKDIEGHKFRVDVGSTLRQAMSDDMPAEVLCFTTDGHIVMNGLEFPDLDAVKAELRRELFSYKIDESVFGLTADMSRNEVEKIMDKPLFDEIVDAITKGLTLYVGEGYVDGRYSVVHTITGKNFRELDLTYKDNRVVLRNYVPLSSVEVYYGGGSRLLKLENDVEELKSLLTMA